MEQLLTIASRAKMRIRLNATLHQSVKWMMYLACVVFLLSVVDRFGQTAFVVWNVIYIAVCIGAVVVATILWHRHTVTVVEAAAEVDHRMHLRDRISSAMSCGQDDTPFSAALLSDAVAVIKKEQVQIKLPQYFSIAFPKDLGVVLAIALASAIIIWSPQWGFFGGGGSNALIAGLTPTRENIESSIDSVVEQIREDEALSKSLEEELAELEAAAEIQTDDPELLRREALRKMTDLQKRLDELLQGEDAMTFDEISKRLQGLHLPHDAPTQPMIAALKNGKFDQAKKELEALEEKMDSNELSKEEREELAKALEELGKQLEELAKINDTLSSALSASGLNGALASNPDAAMKAIKNAKNLNEEQKKKLLEMLKAQQKANAACKKLGQNCKNFAAGKGSEGMASELEQLKAIQMFKTKAQLAKSACQNAGNGMCSKPGSGKGGTGGMGKGNGGQNSTEETDTTTVAQRAPVQTIDGSIIARQLFEGGLLTTSESIAAVRETVLTERKSVEQAIIDEEVPRKYHDVLRHYFGQLEKLTETSSQGSTKSLSNDDTEPLNDDDTEPLNDDDTEPPSDDANSSSDQ